MRMDARARRRKGLYQPTIIDEGDGGHDLYEKLIKALVSTDWSDESIAAAMDKYRSMSRRRRGLPPGTGAYLDVRRGKDRRGKLRTPKIVIVDEGRPFSTGIDHVEGTEPEANPEAVVAFIRHETRAFVKARAKESPGAFRITWLLRQWLEAHYPAPGVPDRQSKLKTYQNYANAIEQIAEGFVGKRLEDWHPEILIEYYTWRLQQPLKVGERDPDDVKDSPAIKQCSLLMRVLDWAKGRFGFEYNTRARMPEPTESEREWLTYDEIIRLLWACLGYVYENGAWKTTIRTIDGLSKTVFFRLPKKEWKRTQWLYRLFVLVLLTGTRYRTADPLHWYMRDDAGCLDAKNGVIWRNGRKAKKYKNKPRGRSELLPLSMTIFRRWLLWDLRFHAKTGSPPRYVVRDGTGGKLRNIDDMLRTVFARAGLGSSLHKLKHAGVTLLAEAGYTRREIADAFCNNESTLKDHYEHIDWDRNERLALHDKRPVVLKFADLNVSPPSDERALMEDAA